jgi:hypothetical protein
VTEGGGRREKVYSSVEGPRERERKDSKRSFATHPVDNCQILIVLSREAEMMKSSSGMNRTAETV